MTAAVHHSRAIRHPAAHGRLITPNARASHAEDAEARRNSPRAWRDQAATPFPRLRVLRVRLSEANSVTRQSCRGSATVGDHLAIRGIKSRAADDPMATTARARRPRSVRMRNCLERGHLARAVVATGSSAARDSIPRIAKWSPNVADPWHDWRVTEIASDSLTRRRGGAEEFAPAWV